MPGDTDRDEDELTNYYEVQLHDPELDLTKVERFTFTDAPPEGEFLELLRTNGIAIFDWRDRSGDPVPWGV